MTTRCASARRSPTTRCLRSRRSCSSPPPWPAWSSAPRPSAGKSWGSSISSSAAKARSPCRAFSREPASGRQAYSPPFVGGVTFVVAATGAFLELQGALNTIWRVKPKPGANLRVFLVDRLRSFGLVVAIGFLLMVSLAVTAGACGARRMARSTVSRTFLWCGGESTCSCRSWCDYGAVRPSLSLPA